VYEKDNKTNPDKNNPLDHLRLGFGNVPDLNFKFRAMKRIWRFIERWAMVIIGAIGIGVAIWTVKITIEIIQLCVTG